MAYGLQCFDAQGRIILDITDSISKVIGVVQTQANVAGSLQVPDFAGGTRVFVSRRATPPSGPFPAQGKRCEVTVNGRTISWTAGRGPVVFTYGVY